jgi:hypothetical protein
MDERNKKIGTDASKYMTSIDVSSRPYPFSGQLINGVQAAKWIMNSIEDTGHEIDICSAFLRSEALVNLLSSSHTKFSGRILVRWQLGDIVVGASDLKSYSIGKQLGFRFLIRQDFHGKVFSIPGKGVIVGSANATLAGFGMKEDGNTEVCTLVPPHQANSIFIDSLFQGAVEIDDALFYEIENVILGLTAGDESTVSWPTELLNKLNPKLDASRFLTSECLASVPLLCDDGKLKIIDHHDQKLLGFSNPLVSRITCVNSITNLKVHRWLVETLKQADGVMYFGSLTAALHNALLDDPGAYRQDVKILLQTLISCYLLLPECGVLVDRPNHSQRIQLKK